MKGEFDPRMAVKRLRDRGARAALPVVVQKATPLQFREWWPGWKTRPECSACRCHRDRQSWSPTRC